MAKSKDHISIYFFRNYIATISIAFVSMIASIISFYQCSLLEAVRRVLLYDMFTTLYFLLIWMVDYIVFEISKILYDMYKDKVKYSYLCVICIITAVISLMIPMLDLFQYNFSLLSLLILLRMIKVLIKDVIVVIKRPSEWSILKKKDC